MPDGFRNRGERIDLAALIEVSLEAIQHQLNEQDGTVSLDVQAQPIVSDRLSLEQIFGNISQRKMFKDQRKGPPGGIPGTGP